EYVEISEGHLCSGKFYSSINRELFFENEPLRISASYKEQLLKSICISYDRIYLNEKYKKEVTEDSISNYVEYCKSMHEKLVDKLSKKRNLNWGKIKVLVDPRDPFVFIELKYNGRPNFEDKIEL
ncbi:hypothetical protein DWB61_17830, partial [Ancylomarina euxinus]